MSESEVRIYLAFRFHGNFYHSYRGDTPDELGFGKDIRIIRKIIEVLDEFNAADIPARGTWDIENYFSFEKIMPEHCPDIIESLQRRVAEGKDEVQVMSYNNGLVSAQTAAEFDAAIGRAISNAAGSGLKDLFAEFAPVVRPQEMMYTPIHLDMYAAHGIDCISLFYSAVPFNAFSNFVPPPSFEESFNPMTLAYPGVDGTMILLPARNHGDIADNVSLRWWIKRLRRRQLASTEPKDLLLLIDADADDEYWFGYDWPVVSRLLAASQGLRGLVESVADLDYVTFTTPGDYLENHEPLGSITIGQDTADGSFDGYSSWAEKWSNHQLWTGIERSRVLELQSRRLLESDPENPGRAEAERLLSESFEARLKAMSTTHFGLSSPVMNVTRLKAGAALVEDSVKNASRAFQLAAESAVGESSGGADSAGFSLLDYVRGLSTDTVAYRPKPSRALVRVPLSISETDSQHVRLVGPNGTNVPFAVQHIDEEKGPGKTEILFLETMNARERKEYRIERSGDYTDVSIEHPASVERGELKNEFIQLAFDTNMQPAKLDFMGTHMAEDAFLGTAINYAGRTAEAAQWKTSRAEVLGGGLVAVIEVETEISFEADAQKTVSVRRKYMLAAGLPYLYVDTTIAYPSTRSDNYKKERARKLQQVYDENWREVLPCEIRPALYENRSRPLRVWKHNYLGHMSSYDLNYGEFSKNTELDSFNNHITHAWVAVSNGEKGLLVAQTADANSCFAFCPMRTRTTPKGSRVFLNPFGAYYGKQLKYITAFTGLGKLIAELMAESLDSFAPSYNGRRESFSLMIAPYTGDEPPEDVRNDAEAFAYPYALVSRSEMIGEPDHRAWKFPVELQPQSF